MRRFCALLGSIALIVLVAATAAMAARSGRAPGVREAQTPACPASTKPSDDTKNDNGQGSGGTNGQGNTQSGTTTGTTDTRGNGNGDSNSGNAGGNGGGSESNNAGGNGNGNANGHGNGQRGEDDCVAPPTDPGGVAGDGKLPPARAGRSVNVEPTDGTVRVKQPDAEGFTPLADSAQLPEGTVIDARNGSLELTSAGTGGQQTAAFTGAKFEVRQEKAKAAVTELVLRGGAFKGCPRLDHGRRAAAIRNGFIASRSKGRRRLFGSGRGRFRTRGRWGSATVRGTTWKVEDTCGGTLTTVVRGVVEVADFGKKKTVRVRAGEEYFSRVRR